MSGYAEMLEVTPTHLARCVKAATGKTAAELLTERTLHAARVLLETSTHPACNISRHLGFGSPAYFTRFMQQHTGLTPRQLRGPRASVPAAMGSDQRNMSRRDKFNPIRDIDAAPVLVPDERKEPRQAMAAQ
ncbi:helix-turn-helix transcriptional regulator [Sulfitobacter albidus]|uniref:helix-turn-helix transcriptional regulator n=1 Tax=Sulfitobacter albidus TaxID=2829501 RepID=UPI0020C8F56E|nr:helix-turn-helix transcriptional regulator [Sulfitobacter albidus]